MKITKSSIASRIFSAVMTAIVIFTAMPFLNAETHEASAASVTASGKISDNYVNLRKSASTSSSVLASLKKGTKVTIQSEVFTSRSSTAATSRWYYVSTGKKNGYVRSDLVNSISFGKNEATSIDALNYRNGPFPSFKRLGTVPSETTMTLLLPAKLSGSSESWYRVKVDGKNAYVSAAYVRMGGSAFIRKSAKELAGKSKLARSLLTNPTNGGKARVVYTFTESNCKKLFSIKGYGNAVVPQGFTYTGKKYYIVYGMNPAQAIVTYSSSGKRLSASKFAFNIGHPNGITYDPATKMCYIFKGNQKRIYTWDPASGKYGKSSTPYSSSGIAYDNATKLLYASSHTGIRAYSADGRFTHQKLFSRCSHGIFHYIQDCGAGEGFIFHGISGANKKKTNYVDVYRAADSAYLGSIKITIGEIESAVVGSDGYLQLLINSPGKTDYIWKTPLNVRELK